MCLQIQYLSYRYLLEMTQIYINCKLSHLKYQKSWDKVRAYILYRWKVIRSNLSRLKMLPVKALASIVIFIEKCRSVIVKSSLNFEKMVKFFCLFCISCNFEYELILEYFMHNFRFSYYRNAMPIEKKLILFLVGHSISNPEMGISKIQSNANSCWQAKFMKFIWRRLKVFR